MRIKFSRLNFETECMWDLMNHRGFIITEMPFSDIDKTVRNMNGPRSPRFGSTYGDPDEFCDRYRCDCSRSIGAVFEGEECPYCHTKIEYKDIDILYTGWISFTPFHIISPQNLGGSSHNCWKSLRASRTL